MTCHLTAFPLTEIMQARLAARETAVICARAILRSPAPHDREDVRLACHTMMTCGDANDWADAYPVLRALDLPPVAVTRPPYSAGTGLIRAALVDCAGLAVIGLLALAVLAW